MTSLARWLYGPSPALLALTVASAAILMFAPLVLRSFPGSQLTRNSPPTVATAAPASDAGGLSTAGGGIGGGSQACLSPVVLGTARIDICWQAYRLLGEEDPGTDYYAIEVSATAHGGAGGMKWAVVRAHPLIGAAIFTGGQSVSLGSGQCQTLVLGNGSLPGQSAQRAVLACERWSLSSPTEAARPDDAQTDWDCGGCLFAVTGDRDVSVVQTISVQSGLVPSWEIGADIGS